MNLFEQIMTFLKYQRFIFIILTLLGLVTVQCGSENSKFKPKPVQKKYYVRGDPMELVKKSKMSPTPDLEKFMEKGKSKFMLSAAFSFLERVEIVAKNGIKDGAESEESPEEVYTLDFSLSEGDENELFSLNNEFIAISAKKSNPTNLVLQNKSSPADNATYELLHFSSNIEVASFSFLLYGKDKSGVKELVALYFTPQLQGDEFPKNDNSKYFYLHGLSWPQNNPLQVNICSSKEDLRKNLIKEGIGDWSKHLANRLDIEINFLKSYPPFSDLNVKCIYSVTSFVNGDSENELIYGTTATVPHYKNKTLVDSDIFMFEDEFLRLYERVISQSGPLTDSQKTRLDLYISKEWKFAITHEFGHMLGLDHPFTKENQQGKYSIMNYESAEQLTEYDVLAIQNLYPLRAN